VTGRRHRLILGLALACLPGFAPVVASANATSLPSFGHVFVIVGENKSLFQLTRSRAPYINANIKPVSAWFTNYNDVVKNSLPNYIAMTSGQYAPCQVKGPCGSFAVPNIFAQLGNGRWKDWNESMPSNCYRKNAGAKSTKNLYQVGHNPALFYTGLPCSTYDVPAGTTGPNDMSGFNHALATGNVPAFNFISPNDCENSHDSCDGGNIVTEFDNFLRKEIPLIQASPAFGTDGVIFVTYDEGYRKLDYTTTMMAVLSPKVRAATYTARYDHYSALATWEQIFGLPCLAHACGASVLPLTS
jgi:hypothetical protein